MRVSMEQAIKDLCLQLMNAKDPQEAERIGEQLRSTIHEHMVYLRQNIVTILPALKEGKVA